jgi:putative transport protein
MVGTLGLALFLYTVGVHYGKQFFAGFTSAHGRRANIMAVTGVLLAGVVSLLCMKTVGIPLGEALGLFAGSGTSTATLQAAQRRKQRCSRKLFVLSVGVADPILFLHCALPAS